MLPDIPDNYITYELYVAQILVLPTFMSFVLTLKNLVVFFKIIFLLISLFNLDRIERNTNE